MEIILKKEDETLFVNLSGDLDINSNKEFKEKVIEKIENVKKIVIDAKNLSYVDSTGLGAFISIYKNLRKGGKENIEINNLKPHIKKIFIITDLDKVFTINE